MSIFVSKNMYEDLASSITSEFLAGLALSSAKLPTVVVMPKSGCVLIASCLS